MRAAPASARVRLAAAVTVLAFLGALAPQAAAAGQAVALDTPTTLPLNDVSYRPDGALALAVGGAPGDGVVLKVAGGQASVALDNGNRLLAVAWAPVGSTALIVGDGKVLRTGDGASFADVALPPGLGSFDGRAVAWKPDGSQALVLGSALLRYWAANQSLELLRSSADEAYAAAAWKPDGSSALLEQARRQDGGWAAGRLLTFDGAALTHVATYGSGQGLVEGIAWAASGAWALVWGHDQATGKGPVMKWDGASLSLAFTKPADRFTGFAWQPGGAKGLFTGSSGERLAESDGASYQVQLDQGADLTAIAWHPGGDHALLTGPGGLLLRWQPAGVLSVRVLAPLPGAVLAGPFEVLAQPEPRAGAPVVAVEARVDQGAWQPLTAPAAAQGAWRLALDAAALGDGAHVVEVRARDAAGLSEPARVPVRVLTQAPAAPAFASPPASDDDGIVPLAWSDTGADRYEVQAARDASFADARTLASTQARAATVALDAAGAHHLRVRGWVGDQASPWSAPAVVQVTLAKSPFLPESPKAPASAGAGGAAGGADDGEPSLRTPGPGALLVVTALGAALLLARRR